MKTHNSSRKTLDKLGFVCYYISVNLNMRRGDNEMRSVTRLGWLGLGTPTRRVESVYEPELPDDTDVTCAFGDATCDPDEADRAED